TEIARSGFHQCKIATAAADASATARNPLNHEGAASEMLPAETGSPFVISRRNGPRISKTPTNPANEPRSGNREGSGALASSLSTAAAHACDCRTTRGSKIKLTCVAAEIISNLELLATFPLTRSAAFAASASISNWPTSTKVFRDDAGGPSNSNAS